MGQSSISILNKVGYSMYWNSMWDNKIIYNRFLKEDIYINKFFDLIFNDNVSTNLYNFKKNNFKKNNFFINQNIDIEFFSLNKYLTSVNSTIHFSSRIWILKYQKWLVLYNFIFLSKINKQNYFSNEFNHSTYKSNFFHTYKYYLKFNNLLNSNYSFYKNKINFYTF